MDVPKLVGVVVPGFDGEHECTTGTGEDGLNLPDALERLFDGSIGGESG